MGRSEHCLPGRLGHNLGRREFHVVVGMLQIAYGIFTLGYVDGLVRHHLDVPAMEYSFVLAGDHVGDPGLAGVEVVTDLFHVEGLAALGHYRLAFPCMVQGVIRAPCEYDTCRHVVFHVIGRQLQVLVRDLNVSPVVHLALAV